MSKAKRAGQRIDNKQARAEHEEYRLPLRREARDSESKRKIDIQRYDKKVQQAAEPYLKELSGIEKVKHRHN